MNYNSTKQYSAGTRHANAIISCHDVPSQLLFLICEFLSLSEKVAVLSTNKQWYETQPISTHLIYHGRNKPTINNKSFWTGYFNAFRGQLLHVDISHARTLSTEDVENSRNINKNIRTLRIDQCLSLNVLEWARTSRQLRVLELKNNPMQWYPTDLSALTQVFHNNPKLHTLSFEGCHRLTDEVLAILPSCKLSSLNLTGCHNLSNAGLVSLVNCCSLTTFDLTYCYQVQNIVVDAIANSMTSLRNLNLRYCYRLTDTSICNLAASRVGRTLQSLNLSQLTRVTDLSMDVISSECQSLSVLRLWGCKKLSQQSMLRLTTRLSSLTLLDVSGNADEFAQALLLTRRRHTYRDTIQKWQQESGVFLKIKAADF